MGSSHIKQPKYREIYWQDQDPNKKPFTYAKNVDTKAQGGWGFAHLPHVGPKRPYLK